MEKVRGKDFCSLFQEFRGDKFINCNITFICKLIIFHTEICQHKGVQFAEEINALQPKFLQYPPPNLIMY